MTPFLHTLHISTLAAWLSVAAFGAAGLLIPGWRSAPVPAREVVTELRQEEVTLSAAGNPGTTEVAAEAAPPDLPELAEPAPLPEIPALPAAVAEPQISQAIAASPASPAPKSSGGSPGQAARGKSAGAPRTASGGLSDAARIAAGQMPAPGYPADAKRKNQTGTAVIEFTVDASGRVIAAYPKSSSGWPLLDAEAINAVRRWTFPAGGVMKLQRPIVFQLR